MARLAAVIGLLLVTSLTFVAPKVNGTAPRVVRRIALLPHSALAGTGSSRPEFQLVRPSYMQGIDAANAAVKPGEIDYITRSRIEAAQLPKAQQEMEMTRVKLQAAPSKEERVAASLKRLREYSGIEG
eukprot:s348_g18.t1